MHLSGRIWRELASVIEDASKLVMFIGFLVLVSSPALLLFQAYLWARSGSWVEMPLSLVLPRFRWVESPTDWFGLADVARVLLKLPLSLVLFLAGWAVCSAGFRVYERVQED